MKPFQIAIVLICLFAIVAIALGAAAHVVDTRRRLKSLTEATIINQRTIQTMQGNIFATV